MHVTICHQSVAGHTRADELDVLTQVDAVEAALGNIGVRTSRLACGLDLAATARALKTSAPDVVFNLVESLEGHGELIAAFPGLLDALKIPYTGAPAEALYLTTNKALARQRLSAVGVPVAAGVAEATGGKFIVKSVWEHASRGIDSGSVVPFEDVEVEILAREQQFGGRFFAEAYIDGREFNVAVLGGPGEPEVLPIAEMVFDGYPSDLPRVVDYAAKWDPSSFGYRHTVRRFINASAEWKLNDRLRQLAVDCWHAFELEGYARVDFRVDGEKVVVVDINANPCLSPDAGYLAALKEGRILFEHAVERVVQAAIVRQPSRFSGFTE